MPATKRNQDREHKRAEIVAAARRLFIADGYEATSMSALATSAGVAGNTIYWYFADKDEVLVAVLNSVLADVLADYEQVATGALDAQLIWIVGQLQQMQRLVGTVHSRAAHSTAIEQWHTQFHETAEALFRSTLNRSGIDGARVDAEVAIGVFAIEGMLTHKLDDAQQRAVCRQLAAQWARR